MGFGGGSGTRLRRVTGLLKVSTGQAREAAAPDVMEAELGLTPVQEGMLLHTLSSPGHGVYRVQLVCTLIGDLDTALFEKALEEVVRRHPILRISVAWSPGGRRLAAHLYEIFENKNSVVLWEPSRFGVRPFLVIKGGVLDGKPLDAAKYDASCASS